MVSLTTLPSLSLVTTDQAERWIAAALSEAKALSAYDQQMYPNDDEPRALAAAEELHAA